MRYGAAMRLNLLCAPIGIILARAPSFYNRGADRFYRECARAAAKNRSRDNRCPR